MATYEHTGQSPSRNLAAVLGRTGLVAAISLVETAALGIWLFLVQNAPITSLATGFGFTALAGGLVVKYAVTDVAVNGLEASVPGPQAIAVVLIEAALWTLWLLTADRVGGLVGIAVAGAVLAALLVPQHVIQDNVLRGQGLVSNLVDLNALGFSLVQAGGATIWLLFVLRGDLVTPLLVDADALVGSHLPVDVATLDPGLVGLAALAAALFVEHVIGVSFSRHGDRARGSPSSKLR